MSKDSEVSEELDNVAEALLPNDTEAAVIEDTTVQPEIIAEEPVVEVVEPESVEPDKFVLKLGHNLWFKSWQPYATCGKKADALVLNSDWARGYASSIKMVKKVIAEIVKV